MSGRVGARLKGSYEVNGLGVEPYVRTNLWHTALQRQHGDAGSGR